MVEVTEKKMTDKATPLAGKKRLQDIKRELYQRHPDKEKVFKKGGANLTYIPWHEAVRVLDKATGAFWDYGIKDIKAFGDQVVVVVYVTVHAIEGDFRIEGQGSEDAKVRGYGDAFSNAESMAYRRACAKLGLGLYLYKKD